MTRDEAQAEIEKHVQAAYAELAKASAIADEHQLTYYFGPEYGMGGSYYGKGTDAPGWCSSDTLSEGMWESSSATC